jgi:hypothetical protein
MVTFASWLPPAVVGVTFIVFGSLKLYGFWQGIEGGQDKPVAQQLCGT